jgi:hypothetical protein
MYTFIRLLRILLIVALLAGITGGVAYFILTNNQREQSVRYARAVTAAVETAVTNALYDATRTVEAPLQHYRYIALGPDEQDLSELAAQYDTTLAVIQMANGLLENVTTGSNTRLVVPQGIQELVPPRRLDVYRAQPGDSLIDLALSNDVPLDILEEDNPVLVNRPLLPGDLVFIARLL